MTPSASGGAAECAAQLFFAFASGGELAAVPVTGDGGVDLAAVGRVLGLDPPTVRFNGHFITRGPDLRSSVTWSTLVAFFSSRGFPAGLSQLDPIVVQGKPATTSEMHLLSSKRKVTLEDEHPHIYKKKRANDANKNLLEVGDERPSDDDILSIKERLKLDDNSSSKKRRITRSESVDEAPRTPMVVPAVGFAFSCINGPRKRSRTDELVS